MGAHGQTSASRARPALRALPLLALPALLLVGLYGRALDYPFVWTDRTAIEGRSMLRPPGQWLQAFREPLHRVGGRSDSIRQPYYRPLQVVLLSFVDSRMGSEPRDFRRVSLAIGAACAMLFAGLAWLVLRRLDVALLAGLLAAAHPAGVEEYVWISGLGGALCALFVLLALVTGLAAVGAERRPAAALCVASTLALMAALLSKERAVVEPALLLAACAVATPRQRARRTLALVLAHAAVVSLYALWWRPGIVELGTALPPVGGSAASQVLTGLASWPASLGWLLLPLRSNASDAVRVVTSFADPMAWLGFGLAVASALAWAALWRAGRAGAALGLAWIWIAFLPTSGLLPTLHVRAERYLFLSSFGAALLVADGLPALARRARAPRALGMALGVALAVLMAGRSWVRVGEWRSTAALFETDVRRDPAYREGRFLLALDHYDAGRYRETDAALRPLLEGAPAFEGTSSYLNRVSLYELACANELALGRSRGAVALVQKLRVEDPILAGLPNLRICLAQAREAMGRDREALEIYREVERELGAAAPPALRQRIERLDRG